MSGNSKKKSPRYPSISLKEAIDKAQLLYESNHLHPVDNDTAAQSMNYSGANNGAALSAMAALRYFGLIERSGVGKLSVAKDVESYLYAPNSDHKHQYLTKWLKTPDVFANLIEKYGNHLPSDAAIRYELLQLGFHPTSAINCIQSFRDSLEFANHASGFPTANEPDQPLVESSEDSNVSTTDPTTSSTASRTNKTKEGAVHLTAGPAKIDTHPTISSEDIDIIPVRLRGGRKAQLHIPVPFYEHDKNQIKAQLDLLLTDGQEYPTKTAP